MRTSLVILPWLLAVALLACDKAKDADPASPPLAEGVAALPAESRVLIGVNVAQLGESPIVGRLVDWMLAADAAQRRSLEALLAQCRLEPGRDLSQVLVAMGETREEVAILVRGNLVETSLLACIKQSAVEKGAAFEAERIAERTTYHIVDAGAGTSIWIAFAADRAVVIATGRAWLEKLLDPAAPKLSSRSDTMALVGRIDAGASIWGATYFRPELGVRIAEATRGAVTKPPLSITGELAVDAGATLTARLDFQSEADAVALAEFARSEHAWLTLGAQRYGLGRIVGKLAIHPDGKTVKLSLQLAPDEIQRLAEALDKLDD